MQELYAEHGGLAGAATALASASQTLAQASRTAATFTPLGADEVSVSAAARLTSHGAILGSRANDGSAVFASAAAAVRAVSARFAETDRANAVGVSALKRPTQVAAGLGVAPAATLNAVAPPTPIQPMPTRDGEVTATLLESHGGAGAVSYGTACATYGAAFGAAATAARTAATAVSGALSGKTEQALQSALVQLANWASAVQTHSQTLASAAGLHHDRFSQAKTATPASKTFKDTKKKLADAQTLERRYPGRYSTVVTTLQTDLTNLNRQATMTAVGYHLGELPAAPPPPPPVTPVVNPGESAPGQAPSDPSTTHGQPQPEQRPGAGAEPQSGPGAPIPGSGLPGTGDDTELGLDTDDLGDEGNLGGAPDIASALPSLMTGLLGGVLGAASSIPQQLSQQVGSVASQAGEAVQGLTQGLNESDLESDLGGLTSPLGGDPLGGLGPTTPAAGPAALPPASGDLLTTGAAAPAAAPAAPSAAPTAGPVSAGPGMPGTGMPMMAPMAGAGMGGSQGGGSRPVKEADKAIHVPGRPHSELVKGEVARREKSVADDPTGEKRPRESSSAGQAVSVRRRIVVPEDEKK